jgi:para-nitrobenzyl esterase
VTAAFADKKNDIVAEFKQAFPRKKVQDVLYYAGGSRPRRENLLARKLEKSKAPVYNYLFAWEYRSMAASPRSIAQSWRFVSTL